MNITAIANQKGGVGKSATALNYAAALAERGRRVLVLDLDPQGNLTESAGIEPAEGDANLANALLGRWTGELGELVRPVVERLWIIPTSDEMFLLEADMYGRTGREYLISRFLDDLAGAFDEIVLDCPPSLGAINDGALVAARRRTASESAIQIQGRIMAPVLAEDSSVKALRLLLRQIKTLTEVLGIDFDIVGLIVTQYDKRKGDIATTTLAAFEAHPLGVLEVFPDRADIRKSWRAQQSVLQYAPRSDSAEGYRRLVDTVEKKVMVMQP